MGASVFLRATLPGVGRVHKRRPGPADGPPAHPRPPGPGGGRRQRRNCGRSRIGVRASCGRCALSRRLTAPKAVMIASVSRMK